VVRERRKGRVAKNNQSKKRTAIPPEMGGVFSVVGEKKKGTKSRLEKRNTKKEVHQRTLEKRGHRVFLKRFQNRKNGKD